VDITELSERLVPFARAKYEDPDVTVDEVVTMPGHAGFAYGFAVHHTGGIDRWFLRLPPPNVRWRGTADMLRQVTALDALEGSDVPHCRVRWYGGPDDLDWFDRPYFVVEQLDDGNVVGMGGTSGWVAELDAAQRTRMGVQAMDALVGIHRVDWRARCAYLGEPVSLAEDVTRWDHFVEKAADRDALRDVPALRQLLLDRMPASVHVGLYHGDFQFSNLWYTSAGELRAVLDWELCGIGATLNDVGWVATFNDPDAWDHEGAVPNAMPRADELVARYADMWGEPLDDLAWFRALAAYKFAIITGFNLGLHRRGKRPDPLWERIGRSMGSLQSRAHQLLTASDA
jgi:aminoglycoside phosphotransferase (APT) family kinase protein